MRKIIIAIGILVLVALATSAVSAGAVVVKPWGCVWDFGGQYVNFPQSIHVLSSEGDYQFTCHGTLDPTVKRPTSSVVWYGICMPQIYPGSVGAFKATVTPSGRVTIYCHGTL